MSAREWKPGDVAVNCGNRVFRTNDGWQFVDGPGIPDFDYNCRPLVVLDPEDREQVKRLARAFRDDLFAVDDLYPGMAKSADSLQAALREFANPTPPKPAEPQGLGAVVEDSDGDHWVRIQTHYSSPWVLRGAVEAGGLHKYADIAAVRVLSAGWSE